MTVADVTSCFAGGRTVMVQRANYEEPEVLCPMNCGGVGARSPNIELQAALNPVVEVGGMAG